MNNINTTLTFTFQQMAMLGFLKNKVRTLTLIFTCQQIAILGFMKNKMRL